MFKRIIDSYNKEIKDFPEVGPYSSSGLWTGAEKPYKDLKKRLENFGSDIISSGLSLSRDVINEERIGRYITLWKRLLNLDLKFLEYPKKFGFKMVRFGDISTIGIATRFLYYASRINELTKSVIEIGGSFGGVPFHLFRDFDFKGLYIGFDLPHSLLLAKYFLTEMFPEKRFQFYGETVDKPDIILLPHFAIKDFKIKCDMVFNAHSLSEMGTLQIEEYIKQVERLSKKYFLHFNHEMQTTKKGEVKKNLNLSNLSIKMKRLYKQFEIFSGDDTLDYFEYLYVKNN